MQKNGNQEMKSKPNQVSWEPSEKQKAYWESMKGRKGKNHHNWKGKKAGKQSMHSYISKHYGTPSKCENPYCTGKSKVFDWCIKTGRKYSHRRSDYLRMCRSCHRAYDLTPRLKEMAIKNLWWNLGMKNPGGRQANYRFSKLSKDKV